MFKWIQAAFLATAILITGCSNTVSGPSPVPPEKQYMPRQGVIRVRMSAKTVHGKVDVSRFVYVFPPLQLDRNKQAMGAYYYEVGGDGGLIWRSPAPSSVDIQTYIQEQLKASGFQIISFSQLTSATTDHQILVMNPYFSEPILDKSEHAEPIVFTRVTIGTYPATLNPEERRDIINQEGLTIYHQDDDYLEVVKRTIQHALNHIGINHDWLQDLSLNSN